MVRKICSITVKNSKAITYDQITKVINNYMLNNPNMVESIENYGTLRDKFYYFSKFGTLLFIRGRNNNIVFKYGMGIFGKKEKQLRKTKSLLEKLLPNCKLNLI